VFTAAEKRGKNLHGRRRVAERRHRERRAANRPDEGVHGVPQRVHPRDFVGDELDAVQPAGDADHPEAAEHLKVRRQRHPAKPRRKANERHRRVQIHAGRQRKSEGPPDEGQGFHGFFVIPP